MADLSKITLPNGTTYDLKDVTARNGNPSPATATPSSVGTAAVGTSAKYAREDHVHNISLATGDSNGQVKIAGTNVSVKGWNTAATYAVETTLANDSKLPTGAAVTAAINNAVDFGTVGSNQNPVYFNNGDPAPIAFTFGVDSEQNVQVGWGGDAPEIDIPTTSALAIDSGGTGATTAAGARTNLGLGSAATYNVVSTVQDDDNLVTNGAILRYFNNEMDYTAGTGITKTGKQFSLTSGVVTAGSAGPTAAVTGTEGTTVAIPRITVDTYGRVTGLTSYNLTNKNTTYTAATTAPGNVSSSSAVGTSTNYARQDHTHGISLATGDANGQVKIAGTNVSVKGLGSAAYVNTESTLANDANLPTGAAVKSFVEGKGYVTTDTKNTAGSTDTSSKIFLIGATSQAANPQTYSDDEVYATSGVLTTKAVQVGGTAATMQYNSTTEAIDFIFS